MKVEQHFFNQSGIIRNEQLRPTRVISKDFSFTKPTEKSWNESNTVKFKEKTVLELQLHNNRSGYKIRLHRENFPELLKKEKGKCLIISITIPIFLKKINLIVF